MKYNTEHRNLVRLETCVQVVNKHLKRLSSEGDPILIDSSLQIAHELFPRYWPSPTDAHSWMKKTAECACRGDIQSSITLAETADGRAAQIIYLRILQVMYKLELDTFLNGEKKQNAPGCARSGPAERGGRESHEICNSQPQFCADDKAGTAAGDCHAGPLASTSGS
jgi:hypothetical protein